MGMKQEELEVRKEAIKKRPKTQFKMPHVYVVMFVMFLFV
ncbi:hypothetical protein HNR44_000705 [Geomicrobium halophilum]|uniref:Uncharacterized protein n=1 Tax=Geomicrobium halophilum TaxID=549000 RepID=A0A841PNH9_9BACL|nr:hypothetical protein [Geomicrobium halophilum]